MPELATGTGWLSTHVLDIARGKPAGGVAIELARLEEARGRREILRSACTNDDGRTDSPLLGPGELEACVYELVFDIGDYFADLAPGGRPPFLDRIPIRFAVSDPSQHYHVPLLASPWSYSTYRGS
jgi:5-hydroxyisourate hydrolase